MTIIDEVITDPRADLTMLTGTWRNTNANSDGIVGMIATAEEHVLWIDLFGSSDWGRVRAEVFYERNDEGLEQPFTASYDFGFMDVVLQGFLRQGVLVILSFTRFKDGSGRSSYFSKEFFYRI